MPGPEYKKNVGALTQTIFIYSVFSLGECKKTGLPAL